MFRLATIVLGLAAVTLVVLWALEGIVNMVVGYIRHRPKPTGSSREIVRGDDGRR